MAKFSIDLQSGRVADSAPTETKGELIVGIDLGTTNSLVAYVNDGSVEAVAGKGGERVLVPSIVHFAEDGEIVVGDDARDFLATAPERTIYSVKRLMGKSYQDVVSSGKELAYEIIDEDEDRLVKIRVGEKFYTPIELSGFILRHLKERIESELDQEVQKAVITVPAYFNDAQRQATRDAGRLAGLDVLRIVNEPTASSLAYGIGLTDQDEGQTIAVYDLGGGTFDISILRIEQGIFEVLSTHGDTQLGGDDFDQAIIDHWRSEYQIDPGSREELSQIRLAAESAKKALSTQDVFKADTIFENIVLSRATFEGLIDPLIEQTLDSSRQALADAGLETSDIDHVIMVGGSTRVPKVKQSVAEFFGQKVNDKLDPDQVVALGAAIQGDVLAGNQKDVLLLDVTPLSLGIETVGGLMDVILPRNSKVPARVGRKYTTSVDGQKNLKVAVFQGERDMVEDNRKLGEFILKDIPPMPAGIPQIEIVFYLDADGILRVKASELRSETEQSVLIKSQYGITEEEMAEMLIESLAQAEGDMARRALAEARVEANNILHSTGKFLDQNRGWLSEVQKSQLRKLATDLKEAVDGTDKDVINAKMASLNEYANPLAHEALDRNVASAMKGTTVEE
ncbi:MAG: Fe-S protein assembly chaperone HscA [Bacteroidota bacterium]